MTTVFAKALGAGRRAYRILYARLAGSRRCSACGFRGRYLHGAVLWPELIDQWELSSEWVEWFDQREGHCCAWCGSNLRSGQLAQAILGVVETMTGARASSLSRLFDDVRARALRIAEINSAGTLHQFLSKCPNLRYSEFGSEIEGVPSEDLMRLSYPDSSFDLVITSDTLEHVPDVDLALSEIHWVMKAGAVHVFTVPIVWDRPQTRQRARKQQARVVHTLPPSYHAYPALVAFIARKQSSHVNLAV